jgi:hypothetical protein
MTGEGNRPISVGLLADPDLPAELAEHLTDVLPEALARAGDGRQWHVEALVEPLVGGDQDSLDDLTDAALGHKARHEWDLLIVLTDLPRREGTRAVVAEVHPRDGVALASLPALGALALRRRVLAVAVRLVLDLVGPPTPRTFAGAHLSRLDRADGGYRLTLPVGRGRWRLFVGMVRANRPWRLVTGLSGALIAAFATSAFGAFAVVLWTLADQLGVLRLTLATVVSVAVMVGYLIVEHRLWERPDNPDRRRRARLYNAATMTTLVLGVGIFYVVLFLLLSLALAFVLDVDVVSQNLGHRAMWTDYLEITWLIASLATVGGAVASGAEDEDTVRKAAYGPRQRARLEAEQARSDADDA